MQHLRIIYDAAKYEYNDEENCIINIPYSPFSRYKMPKVQPTEHRVLNVEHIQKIIDHPYTGKDTMEDLAKDVFILSFAMMGINTADLYEGGTTNGDIFTYRRKKTRDRREDRAEMKVRIEPEIMGLFLKYKGCNSLLRFSERYKDEKAFNRAVNAGLDKIGAAIGVPNLTFYYARHTMASICANKLGVDIARVDEMLNHSDSRLRMARVYIQKDFKPLWDANRRLLDLFDWSYIEKAEG
jgi:integrase